MDRDGVEPPETKSLDLQSSPLPLTVYLSIQFLRIFCPDSELPITQHSYVISTTTNGLEPVYHTEQFKPIYHIKE